MRPKKQKLQLIGIKKSGMVINASKTEAAYFSLQKLSNPPMVNINGIQIELKKTLSVLGLTFDHKLHWVFTLKKS